MAKQLVVTNVVKKEANLRVEFDDGRIVHFTGKQMLLDYLEGPTAAGDELQKAVLRALIEDGFIDDPTGFTPRTYEEQAGAKKL